MENKMKKTIALGAVIMLCAVAVIGVGYAAVFNGNARTYNSGNSTDAGYMTLTPSGDNDTAKWQAITVNANSEFDSYTYYSTATKVAYNFTNGGSGITLTSTNCVSPTLTDDVTYFSKSLGEKTLIVNNGSGKDVKTIQLTVTPTDKVGNAEFVYFIKVAAGSYEKYAVLDDASAQAATAKVFDGITNGLVDDTNTTDVDESVITTLNITVTLYVGYVANVTIPDNFIGPATSTANNDAHESASLVPVGFDDLSFGFAIVDTTA